MKRISCIVVSLSLALSLALPASAAAPSFPDVPQDYWGRPYIQEMTQKGVVTGVGGGLFEPEGPTAVSALCSKGIFPVSSRPPCTKRRLSVRLGGGYSAFSAHLAIYSPILSASPRLVKTFLRLFPSRRRGAGFSVLFSPPVVQLF